MNDHVSRVLNDATYRAVKQLEAVLRKSYPIQRIVLFGSTARGQARPDSDIDLLVITSEPVTYRMRHQMVDAAFDVNLEYSTDISINVVDLSSWENGLLSVAPFHNEVVRDGIPL